MEKHGVVALRRRYGKARVARVFRRLVKATAADQGWGEGMGAGLLDLPALLAAPLPAPSLVDDDGLMAVEPPVGRALRDLAVIAGVDDVRAPVEALLGTDLEAALPPVAEELCWAAMLDPQVRALLRPAPAGVLMDLGAPGQGLRSALGLAASKRLRAAMSDG